MKTTLYLIPLLLLVSFTALAQQPILNINFEKIKGKLTESFDDDNKTIIVVFKSQSDLIAHAKQLSICVNIKKLTDKKSNVFGKQKDVTKSQLIYDLTKNIDNKTGSYHFAFVSKGKKIADLLLQRKKDVPITPGATKQPQDNSDDVSTKPPVYAPVLPPPGFDVLKDLDATNLAAMTFPSVSVFNPPAGNYGVLNYSASSDVNRVIYSFCDNTLYYEKKKNRFRPKVGTPLTFELNTVPNPARYDVSIKSSYMNYNTQPDSLLQKYLLNSVLATTVVAQAGGTGAAVANPADPAVIKKNVLLGYLQKIQVQLQSFLDDNLNNSDCIDADLFNRKRKKIKMNIDDQLKAYDVTYPGDLLIYLTNQFAPADSNYVNPVINAYKIFNGIKIAPYVYKIIQLDNADELIINLSIKPKANSGATNMVDTVINTHLSIFGGFKIDFSPGFFYNSFTSPSYSLRLDSTILTSKAGTDSATNKYKTIIQEKRPNYEIGFSSFMHFYTRTGKWVNFAATIGAGVTIDSSPQVRYLIGGSVIFGRNARIAVSYGYSFGQINQLSDQYTNMRAPATDTGPATKKIWDHGHFFSISYNIPLYKTTSGTGK